MGDQLIAAAILLPVVAAVLVYLIPHPLVRRGLVIASAVLLTAVAIALATYETLDVNLPPLGLGGLDWATVLTVADGLLVVLFVYVALRTRNRLAIGLAIVQLVAVAYVKLGLHHAEVTPTFALDRLSTILGLIVSVVGSLICVYSLRYMDEHEEHHHVARSRQPRFFFFMLAFLGAMNGLVFANDLGWLFFFWEITTLCSFLLISHDGTPLAIANAARALWMNLLGGIGFSAAIWLLTIRGHETSLKALVDGSAAGGITLLALALLVFAGFTKAAQMPFQSWLLGAMVAPTPVSALLHSSAMVKAGVYLIVRLAPGFRDTPLSYAVAFAGAFTFVVAALLALTQSDGKRVLAYSTVSNLGLIVACAGIDTSLSLAAAALLILYHAVSKALLFLTVGSIEHAIGSRNIEAMEGLASRHGKLAIVAAVGIVSMALPPGGMLLAKWIAIESAGSIPLVTVLIAVGSAATLGFWTRWLGRLFTSSPGAERSRAPLALTYWLTLGPLVAAIGVFSLGAGIIVGQYLEPGMRLYFAAGTVAQAGPDVVSATSSFPIGWIFATTVVALGLPALAVAIKPSQVRPAYLCGENVAGATSEEFYSAGEQPARLGISGNYFRSLFREEWIVRWGNPLAILLIIALLWMGVR